MGGCVSEELVDRRMRELVMGGRGIGLGSERLSE